MNPYATPRDPQHDAGSAPLDPRIARGVLDLRGDDPPADEIHLWDLPIFGWAWREDGKDLRA